MANKIRCIARRVDNGRRETAGGGRPPTATPGGKLIQVTGSGLSGPFIRRPVMTVLLTLSVIVAGIATYNKLAVNDLPAVDYPIIQVTCAYPGADPVDDGEQHRHAARETISPNSRSRHHHEPEHAEQHFASRCNLFSARALPTRRRTCRPRSNARPGNCRSICRARRRLRKRIRTIRRFIWSG